MLANIDSSLYPTRERLQKVRAMHYSNGISSGPLWTAYALFDFCFLLLIAILTTVIWLTNGYAWYGLGYMFVYVVAVARVARSTANADLVCSCSMAWQRRLMPMSSPSLRPHSLQLSL